MLDSVTRKRIDNCRDILVGKLPSPSAQVEQITIALIYKFMDDMDRVTVEEYGGNPTFFKGDFEKYSWQNIYSPRTDAHQMLNLYAEGIQKMGQNPGLNPMFRSIFKDAFLPYRDPETLRLFLSTINEFSYEHSEMLGDAFEYLLSIMGSQGDAGQFRTPRHIIDFLVELVDPKIGETILDPACGTSGFLISAYKHILNSNKKDKPGDLLSSTQKKELLESINGYDISPDMVRLSSANLFLHGFTDDELNIHEYDTLSSEDRWNEYYDVIIANPPFMTPKGGIRPHNRFSVDSNRAEVLFTNYIMEHLTPKGRAGIVVPEGVIFQSGKAYKQLRKALVEKYLIGVISLPSGVFNPYSGVKTSILILDRELSQKTDKIFFSKVENDGFDLGAQRRQIDKNDLPKIKSAVLKRIQNLHNGINDEPIILSYISKNDILNSTDLSLNYDSYYQYDYSKAKTDFYSLKDIIEVEYGKRIVKKNDAGTLFPVYGGGGETFRTDTYNREDRLIISRFAMSPFCVRFVKGKFFLNDSGFTIKVLDSNVCIDEYINIILSNIQDRIYRCGKGAAQKNIDFKTFYNLKIPIPSLEIQKEIVEELEQYQKVIDGAKQVIDNYKPVIDIDPNWQTKPLIEVCDKITDGTHHTPKYVNEGVPFLRVTDITKSSNSKKFITYEEHKELIKRCHPEKDDILYTKNGTIGVAKRVSWDYEFSIFVSLCLLKPNKEIILPEFLELMMNTDFVFNQATSHSKSNTITNLHLIEIKKIKIPVLDKSIQRRIIDEVNIERQIVEGNKKLIEIYTQKIEDRINKIWGE